MTTENDSFADPEDLELGEALDEDDDSDENGLEATPNAVKKERGPSMRKAINEMCKSCIWDIHSPGNWRQQCSACTVEKCPLYPFRPKSKPRSK